MDRAVQSPPRRPTPARVSGASPPIWDDESATASMETLLCLPFLLVLLVLVVDLGFGSVIRIKTQCAVRFAGTSFMRAPDAVSRSVYAEDLLRSYYPGLDLQETRFAKGPKSPFLSSRRAAFLTVAVDPPFATLLSPTSVEASFLALNYRVWGYDRAPLAVGPILDKADDPSLEDDVSGPLASLLRALAAIFSPIAWLLGMKP